GTDESFLCRAGDQAPVARKDARASEAARARGTGALYGIQKPLVNAQRAVEPHCVVDTSHDEGAIEGGRAVRQRGRIQQKIVGHVGEQAAVQLLPVRNTAYGTEPYLPGRAGTARTDEVQRLHA